MTNLLELTTTTHLMTECGKIPAKIRAQVREGRGKAAFIARVSFAIGTPPIRVLCRCRVREEDGILYPRFRCKNWYPAIEIDPDLWAMAVELIRAACNLESILESTASN